MNGWSARRMAKSIIQIRLALPEFYDEQEVEDAIVELYEALNDLHRAEGGSGLKVEDDRNGDDAES